MQLSVLLDALLAFIRRLFAPRRGAAPKAVNPPPAAIPPNPVAPPCEIGPAGIQLIQRWEGCAKAQPDGRFAAYPDPGSRDGKPWTVGWGATGAGIGPDTVWTKEQCDARLTEDLKRFAGQVAKAIGDAPTTQNQFDALVSFHYNTGAIATATLTKLHRAGQYDEAAAQFGKWIFNAGKPLEGLKKRRADEATLYQRQE